MPKPIVTPLCALLPALLLLLTSCSDLQRIEPNICGNRVVDVGEACDEGGETARCTAECRLLCIAAQADPPDGYVDNPEDAVADGFCPAGQACGVSGLCAAPSGKFRAETAFELDVAQAEVGDVNGDGAADLVSTSATELRIQLGDADGAPLASISRQPSPSATGPFLLADLDDSGGVDLAIPTDGGVVPFFDTSGTLQHRAAPTLQIPREGNVAALDGIVAEPGAPRRPLLVFVEAQGQGVVLRDLIAPDNRELARCETGGAAAVRRGPLAVAAIATGDLLAVAVDRAAGPGLCVFAPANPTAPADPGWTPRFFALAAGARFETDLNVPILWANLDGDPCPELLAPTLTGAAAGYTLLDNSGGTCGFASVATVVPGWPAAAARALGAGDLDRSGAEELVTTSAVWRVDSFSAATRLDQPVGMDRVHVADFSGDGVVDIAGVELPLPGEPSREAIRILRTTGTPGSWQATSVIVETLRPVAQVVSGDYDGDGISDLALTEVIAVSPLRVPTEMAVSVIYGQRSGIPAYQVVLEEQKPLVIATLGERGGTPFEHDGAEDLGVAIAEATAKVATSVLFGSAQRSLTAPLARQVGAGALAVAAGPWANSDALLDLVVYADAAQYVWPQAGTSSGATFDTTAAGSPSPIDSGGVRDFAIITATTQGGGSTVVSATPSQHQAAVGGVGACPSTWVASELTSTGTRPTLLARDVDGQPGDELLLTTQTAAGVQPIFLFNSIGADCRLGASLLPADHRLYGCDTATLIEASASAASAAAEPARREILAVCRQGNGQPGASAPSRLIRFDFVDGAYEVAPLTTVQLSGRARRLLRGDFTGDGLEDALSINTIGSIDFATLLVQCDETDARCDP
jgi:hypothetical protein